MVSSLAKVSEVLQFFCFIFLALQRTCSLYKKNHQTWFIIFRIGHGYSNILFPPKKPSKVARSSYIEGMEGVAINTFLSLSQKLFNIFLLCEKKICGKESYVNYNIPLDLDASRSVF